MGEVVYGVVFGKESSAANKDGVSELGPVLVSQPIKFSDDVQLPSDTEPPDESA